MSISINKLVYNQVWKEQNKEHLSNYGKEYRKKNVEKIASYTKFSNIEKVIRQKLRRIEYFDKFCQIITDKGGKVLSDIHEYKTAHSKLSVKCNKEHCFTTTLSNSNKDRWCADCNCYQNELYAKYVLEHIFKQDFVKVRPRWLVNEEGNKLEIDMYNEDLNLAVEYNGIQHYKYIEYFHKSNEKLQRDDRLKEKVIKENNITFFIIPYTVLDIYKYILNKLDELKIVHDIPTYPPPKIDIFSFNEGMNKVLKIISTKNGQLIEGSYVTGESPVKIKCSKGHEWDTKMCKIISGSWCHICGIKVSEKTKEKISKTMKEKIASGEIKTPPLKQKTIRVELDEKKCTKCNKVQTIDNFNKKADTADGFQPYCKCCVNAAKKKRKEAKTQQTFVCDQCSKTYALKDSLTRHIKEKH